MAETYRTETLAVHAGREVDPATGAVSPPLYLSTTFQKGTDCDYTTGYSYIRDQHPNRARLELALAAIEGGRDAVAFASGTAATLAVFHAVGRGHIVATGDAYHGTLNQLRELVTGWGSEVSFVATSSSADVRDALRDDTRLVWIETPSNPLLRVSDIAALSEMAHRHGAVVAVDSTVATPILQRPLDHGADLVVHSSTKAIGGHSDVAGGAVVGNPGTVMEKVRHYLQRAGAVPSPFDCWLLLRSLATLPMRVRQQTASALTLARFLNDRTAVATVDYPGLATHPDYAIAGRQMHGYGSLLSFRLAGGRQAALDVAARVRLFTRATSLGGVESLIEHRASVEGPDSAVPPNLLRLSIGIEHVDDLIDDLGQALEPLPQ